jgi:hypothetical protein
MRRTLNALLPVRAVEHHYYKEDYMNKTEMLLAIHNQCETTQNVIGTHYHPCDEILREVLHLLVLLFVYVVKHH